MLIIKFENLLRYIATNINFFKTNDIVIIFHVI